MKLKDNIPEVIHECQQRGEVNQTDLTEAVWGESGRGNTTLTTILFPSMVSLGYLKMRKAGRSKMFSATEKGIAKAAQMVADRGYAVIVNKTCDHVKDRLCLISCKGQAYCPLANEVYK